MSFEVTSESTLSKRQQNRLVTAFTPLHRITTTIEWQWLAKILTGEKKIEYREIKPYWTKRLTKNFKPIKTPFELRLINGMSKSAPEAIVLIKKLDVGKQGTDGGDYPGKVYRLHIDKILSANPSALRKLKTWR